MGKCEVLPIVVKCDPIKDEYVFIGNGFLIGTKFVSVAHNFPHHDWTDAETEQYQYFVNAYDFFAISNGKQIQILANDHLFKEYKPKDEYSAKKENYLDLVIFNLGEIEGSKLEFADKDLARGELGIIKGFCQDDSNRGERLPFEALIKSLHYQEIEYFQCSAVEGAACDFSKTYHVSLQNCFTLEGAGASGLSGSPILDKKGDVAGIFALNHMGKIKRSTGISKSYLETAFQTY